MMDWIKKQLFLIQLNIAGIGKEDIQATRDMLKSVKDVAERLDKKLEKLQE